jgi:hypothetical protein
VAAVALRPGDDEARKQAGRVVFHQALVQPAQFVAVVAEPVLRVNVDRLAAVIALAQSERAAGAQVALERGPVEAQLLPVFNVRVLVARVVR